MSRLFGGVPLRHAIARVTPDVVNQLRARLDDPDVGEPADLRALADLLALEDLRDFMDQNPELVSPRLIHGPDVTIHGLWALEAEAYRGGLPPLRSMVSYFMLRQSGESGRWMGSLLKDLNELKSIDVAYAQARVMGALCPPLPIPKDPYFAAQGYLMGCHEKNGLNSGVNATNPGVWWPYDGSGVNSAVGFVDLESGWQLDHCDFPAGLTVLNPPFENVKADEAHGTKSLGQVIALRNDIGIAGLAAGCDAKGVLSIQRPNPVAGGLPIVNTALAIVAAVLPKRHVVPGDVLLIEVQEEHDDGTKKVLRPIESIPECFDAIRLVSALGVVVIEPSGNGGLTNVVGGGGTKEDSGAVMVSGCERTALADDGTHEWDYSANRGPRIDCYAWSEYAWTTRPTNAYGVWGGTSAASSIIAGVAIVVQDMFRKTNTTGTTDATLSPVQLREVLRNWSLGTPVVDAGGVRIGVQPDLGLIGGGMGAIPDVYCRDSVWDDGTVPSAMVSQSPDVFVKNSNAADPDQAYGEPSGAADQMITNDLIVPGATHYVYVRLLNRSNVDAVGVEASVYWGDSSTIVTPSSWRPVGTTAPITVPAGDVLTVAAPIEWTPTPQEVPSTGHGCFVAVVHHGADPAPVRLPDVNPDTGHPVDWATFLEYVSSNNNVAWRNFNVLMPEAEPGTDEPEEAQPTETIRIGEDPSDWEDAEGCPIPDTKMEEERRIPVEPLPAHDDGFRCYTGGFVLRGAPDGYRPFLVGVGRELPEGSSVWWDVPAEVAAAMGRGGVRPLARSDMDGVVRLALPEREVVRFPRLKLRPGTDYPCALRICVPLDGDGGEIAVRQLYQGLEVGRVTFRLSTPDVEEGEEPIPITKANASTPWYGHPRWTT